MSLEQPKNPLHGVTLAQIVTTLSEYYGWEELGKQVVIRCFTHDPSLASSLKFLRRTPWAREKVESFYLWHLRDLRRQARADARPGVPGAGGEDVRDPSSSSTPPPDHSGVISPSGIETVAKGL
jgi:uncharacterized protein (DUF2132 family)